MVDTPSAMDKPSVAIIGAGRVGSTLAQALHAAGYPITAVWSRTSAHATDLAQRVGAAVMPLPDVAEHAALTLIAVSDDSLAGLVEELAEAGAWTQAHMVVHCSGVLPAAVLAPAAAQGALIGGFHPLAAIAGRHQALPPGITFGIEADEPLRGTLHQMAQDLHSYSIDLDPAHRPLYHAAAVLASNYTVVLAALARELLELVGADGDAAQRAILPLLRSTLANLERAGLPDGLTGPLVRGDAGTVVQHLAALDATAPRIADVYRVLGLAALPLVEARGNLDPATLAKLEDAIGGVLLERGASAVEGQRPPVGAHTSDRADPTLNH